MLKVRCGDREKSYYSLSESARLINRNRWGVPVRGLHSENLRRTHRDMVADGKRSGVVIGRDMFFTLDDLRSMGYGAEDDQSYIDIGEVVELILEGDETQVHDIVETILEDSSDGN